MNINLTFGALLEHFWSVPWNGFAFLKMVFLAFLLKGLHILYRVCLAKVTVAGTGAGDGAGAGDYKKRLFL